MNTKNLDLEISTLLTLSTCHIPQAAAIPGGEEMTKAWGDPYILADYEEGFLYMVSFRRDAPMWLHPIVKIAKAAGCQWIRFDRDGPQVEGLAVYEW